MFHNSTQKKFWTFVHEEDLKALRKNANDNYRKEFCSIHSHNKYSTTDDKFFMTLDEHVMLVQHYEKKLKEFCWQFQPPMPLNVVGTACQYMKRLFLQKSVMDYHPKLMSLVCIWLACKTEEFNVSMDQFQQNVHRTGMSRNPEIGDAILALELILIEEICFHLVVHNPFRPLEGFLIDIKTRFSAPNPEQLRDHAKDFIVRSLDTNVSFLFSPSQIALSALLSSASKRNIIIDRYVTDVLLRGQSTSLLKETIQRVKKIRTLVKSADSSLLGASQLDKMEAKMEKCRNKTKDPTSAEYQRIQMDMEQERDARQSKKRRIEQERRERIEVDLLGF